MQKLQCKAQPQVWLLSDTGLDLVVRMYLDVFNAELNVINVEYAQARQHQTPWSGVNPFRALADYSEVGMWVCGTNPSTQVRQYKLQIRQLKSFNLTKNLST